MLLHDFLKNTFNVFLSQKGDFLHFTAIPLKNADDKALRPHGYIENFYDNLIYITATGEISTLKNLSGSTWISKPVDSNLSDFFKTNTERNTYLDRPIRDVLIHDNNIFVVYIDNLSKPNSDGTVGSFTAVAAAKIKADQKLVFKKIFDLASAKYPDNSWHAGGKIQHYADERFLLAVPDSGDMIAAQDLTKPTGKILVFQPNNPDYRIFSTGHRNPQGLIVDNINNLILATEHGPRGGDEINIIKRKRNYGWPLASYGSSTGYEHLTTHRDHGFEEPVIFFKNNPGLSEIDRIPISKTNTQNICYAIGSLSGTSSREGHHLYIMCGTGDEGFEITDKFNVGDRIRDVKYLNAHNKIAVVTENSPQILILDIPQRH